MGGGEAFSANFPSEKAGFFFIQIRLQYMINLLASSNRLIRLIRFEVSLIIIKEMNENFRTDNM